MTSYKYWVEQKPPERNQVQNADLIFSVSPVDDNLLGVSFMTARAGPVLFTVKSLVPSIAPGT